MHELQLITTLDGREGRTQSLALGGICINDATVSTRDLNQITATFHQLIKLSSELNHPKDIGMGHS
jgi:hypothetical protein